MIYIKAIFKYLIGQSTKCALKLFGQATNVKSFIHLFGH